MSVWPYKAHLSFLTPDHSLKNEQSGTFMLIFKSGRMTCRILIKSFNLLSNLKSNICVEKSFSGCNLVQQPKNKKGTRENKIKLGVQRSDATEIKPNLKLEQCTLSFTYHTISLLYLTYSIKLQVYAVNWPRVYF